MTASLPLMIFAAGFGTRMGELTRDRPKPLIPVAGKPLIDRALDTAAQAGCAPVVVNVHYLADRMIAHLAGRDARISEEPGEIRDTGGGLKQALPLLGPGPVATLNPDAVWSGPNPLRCLAEKWDARAHDALLLAVPLQRTVGRRGGGDFRAGPDGRPARGGDLVYGGAQIIKPERVAEEPGSIFSLNRVWDRLLAENRLAVTVYPGRWCDVGHPEGISLAEALIADDV